MILDFSDKYISSFKNNKTADKRKIFFQHKVIFERNSLINNEINQVKNPV